VFVSILPKNLDFMSQIVTVQYGTENFIIFRF